MNLSHDTTIEDILNYKKEEIKSYLKQENQKVSGSKHPRYCVPGNPVNKFVY